MARISNGIITVLNVITLLIGCVAMGTSFWFMARGESRCQQVLQMPLLIVGCALFVVSLIGLVGACKQVKVLMFIYQLVLFVLILGLVAFMIFTFIVTNKSAGKVLSNRGIGEHKLGDYSKWLQKYVINEKNWAQIKSCLSDAKLCQSIEGGKGEEFYKQSLSAFQSGCCKPPNYCGFEFHNATFWTMPATGPAAPHADCSTWSNVQTKLCFDCESCKTTVLENIKREWRSLLIINAVVIVIVIIVYSIGCCALENKRYSHGYNKHSYP